MKFIPMARAALFLAMLNPAMLMAELPGLQVHVKHVSPVTGTVEVSLFDSAESFLVTPYLQQSGKVSNDGSYTTRFAALPAGDYAVVVVHDANDNGQLDLGFLNFGGEDYAYSNQIRPWFGRPDFDEVRFTVADSEVVIEIDLD
jgi:uncharacterized protein (DUF2141 family)